MAPFESPATGAAPTTGTLRPGEVATIADERGPLLLVRVRDVRERRTVPGLAPESGGDVFLEVTVELDVLRSPADQGAASGLPILWKVFGAQEVSGGEWPPNPLDVRSVAPGVRTGELGLEVPPVGEVIWRVFGMSPAASSQFELRPPPSATASPATDAPVSGGWVGLRWSEPSALPAPSGGRALAQGIAAFGNAYVVTGSVTDASGGGRAAAWRSTDGQTWQMTFMAEASRGTSTMSDVTVVAGRLVAMGRSGIEHCSAPGEGMTCDPLPVAIWTSDDGASWKRVATPASFDGATVSDLAASSSELLLVGDTGWDRPWIWSSADGTRWTRESMAVGVFDGAHLMRIAATQTGWVLVGSLGGTEQRCCVNSGPTGRPAAWISSDGNTWHHASTLNPVTGRGELGSLSAGAAGLVAIEEVGGPSAGSIRWTSADGRTWSNASWSPDAAGPIQALASDGNRILWTDAPQSGRLAYFVSIDGTTWRPLASTGATDGLPGVGPGGGPQLSGAYLTPDGLVALGFDSTTGGSVVWVAHAITAG